MRNSIEDLLAVTDYLSVSTDLSSTIEPGLECCSTFPSYCPLKILEVFCWIRWASCLIFHVHLEILSVFTWESVLMCSLVRPHVLHGGTTCLCDFLCGIMILVVMFSGLVGESLKKPLLGSLQHWLFWVPADAHTSGYSFLTSSTLSNSDTNR